MSLELRIANWVDLGRTDYRDTFELQQELVKQRRLGNIPDTILIAEHNPIVDFGSAASGNQFSKDFTEKVYGKYGGKDVENFVVALEEEGVAFSITSRGGGATYIGPGQLMVYPIVDFSKIIGKKNGVGEYKTLIDSVMQRVLQSHGVPAEVMSVEEKLANQEMRADRKDVWLNVDGKPHKMGGKGVHISGDIAYHGFNIYTNLEGTKGFSYINPCGFSHDELGVTSIEGVTGRKVERNSVRDTVLRSVKELFGYESLERAEVPVYATA